MNTCLEVGEEILGTKERVATSTTDDNIKLLSEERKNLKRQMIDSSKDDKRSEMKNKRRNLKKEIDAKLKEKEERELDSKMEHLEKLKDDNSKYHYIMRDLNRPKEKIPILVKNEQGEAPGTTQEKIKIIEEYFKKTLAIHPHPPLCYGSQVYWTGNKRYLKEDEQR